MKSANGKEFDQLLNEHFAVKEGTQELNKCSRIMKLENEKPSAYSPGNSKSTLLDLKWKTW